MRKYALSSENGIASSVTTQDPSPFPATGAACGASTCDDFQPDAPGEGLIFTDENSMGMEDVEAWAQINPWYWVSSHGRVKSFKRRRPIFLKGRPDGNGYLVVRLMPTGMDYQVKVHKLVAEAFIGPRPKGLDINHIDAVKTNNNASNLEYVTRSENVKHAYRHGLGIKKSENHGHAKLNWDKVEQIRRRRIQGETSVSMGTIFGVTAATISKVCTGRTWRLRRAI